MDECGAGQALSMAPYKSPCGDSPADDAIDRARDGLQAWIGRTRAHIDGPQAAEPDGLTDRELRRALNAAEKAELARLYDGTISQATRQGP